MNIEDCTHTKGGQKVRIWEVINGMVYGRISHGAMIIMARWRESDGLCLWHSAGMFENPGYDLDLRDWKDKIPWGCIRDDIVTIARDHGCKVWSGYTHSPSMGQFRWTWNKGKVYNLDCVQGIPEGPDNWEEAIARRTEK